MFNLFFIAAARPNFVKIAPFFRHIKKYPLLHPTLIHTGQHYDKNMSDSFFEILKIPSPDIHLGIGGGSHAEQTGKTMIEFEKICIKHNPHCVIVFGDVNATVACTIAAKKCHVPVAHVEAGLRSFDRHMPEEINRILTDSISDILYTTSLDANNQLIKEGIDKEKIAFVGNVMIDTLLNHRKQAMALNHYQKLGLEKQKYCYMTMHRPSNVDTLDTLTAIVDSINILSKNIPIVWPLHPRVRQKLIEFDCLSKLEKNPHIIVCPPLNYLENINLTGHARFVITDSGGLQEETTILQVPCLTLRKSTERPITITQGSNQLIGSNPTQLLKEAKKLISQKKESYPTPPLWDGHASIRILDHIQKFLSIYDEKN